MIIELSCEVSGLRNPLRRHTRRHDPERAALFQPYRALVAHSELDAKAIVTEAMRVAASICVYTNDQITVETL